MTLEGLRTALRELVLGTKVLVFGSVVRPGGFGPASDVDIALFGDSQQISQYRLQSLLEERLGRRVDVSFLSELPFAQTVMNEGEVWTS